MWKKGTGKYKVLFILHFFFNFGVNFFSFEVEDSILQFSSTFSKNNIFKSQISFFDCAREKEKGKKTGPW